MGNWDDANAITATKNHWRVPSEDRAFDGWIEGRPTEKQKQEVLEAARVARLAWKPSEDGLALVEKLKEFVGWRIQVQFWDPIMYVLEDEGPYPVQGDLVEVKLQEDDGYLQAYLVMKNLTEQPSKEGYSATGYFRQSDPVGLHLASLADIYKITRGKKL